MNVSRALDQIAEIHQQLAKSEVYRGYRPLPLALSGVAGLAAALVQPRALGWNDPIGFVLYWTVVAAISGAIASSEIVYNYVVHEDTSSRRRTRRVIAQMAPALAAGAILSVTFVRLSPALVAVLPGLWALLFGLGVFASRPYLPRATGVVALFYFVAGLLLLWTANTDVPRTAFAVGGTFGVGQIVAAFVLYLNKERHDT